VRIGAGAAVDDRRGGFALGLVVLLLFAIGVAGAVGYQVVQVESQLSNQAREMNLALSVADAGLKRFLGEHRGHPPDTTIYGINGGQAVVITRKLADVSDEEDLYHVSSTGTYADPLYADAPATRTVHQQAMLKTLPFNKLGAFTRASTGEIEIQNGGVVDGNDNAPIGFCPGAGLGGTDIGGIVSAGWLDLRSGYYLRGNPAWTDLGTYQATVDALQARWDILTDPTYPVDIESSGGWASHISSLPSDSFPVVRVSGDLVAGWGEVGRGVLIVTGRIWLDDGFSWNGIIMAGTIGDSDGGGSRFYVYGLVAAGLATNYTGRALVDDGYIRYHSCYALWAGESIAHFEPIENTWWEEY
jgi:hypothetical protein